MLEQQTPDLWGSRGLYATIYDVKSEAPSFMYLVVLEFIYQPIYRTQRQALWRIPLYS